MNLHEALQTFVVECRELLEGMESSLLTGGRSGEREDVINAIFRAAHTIKGSAGLFRLEHVVEFTHVVESVLDALRNGKVELSDELVSLLLECGDHISRMIDEVAAGSSEADPELTRAGAPLTVRLHMHLRPLRSVTRPLQILASGPELSPQIVNQTAIANNWHLSLKFNAGSRPAASAAQPIWAVEKSR